LLKQAERLFTALASNWLNRTRGEIDSDAGEFGAIQ
jgi:hypothetical protein